MEKVILILLGQLFSLCAGYTYGLLERDLIPKEFINRNKMWMHSCLFMTFLFGILLIIN